MVWVQYKGLDSTSSYNPNYYLDYTFQVHLNSSTAEGYDVLVECSTGLKNFADLTEIPAAIRGNGTCSSTAENSFSWLWAFNRGTYNSVNNTNGTYDSFIANGTHYYMNDPVLSVGDTI